MNSGLLRGVTRRRWLHRILSSGPRCRFLRTLEGVESVPVVTQQDIQSLLDSKKYSYKLGHSSFVLQCPFCQRKGTSGIGIDRSMFVNYNTGSVVCKPCALRGSWSDFLGWAHQGKSLPALSDDVVHSAQIDPKEIIKEGTKSVLEQSSEHAQKVWSSVTKWEDSPTEVTSRIKEVFGIEKLHSWCLEKHNVCTSTSVFPTPSGSPLELPCVAFPWYQDGRLVRVKLDTVALEEERQVGLEPKEGNWGLFGWNVVHPNHKEIVITANEFDAVAVHQSIGLPAIALPSGTSTLPPEVLPQLEQFKKVYLWLGSSVQARQASTHFAKKLNLKRCYIVSSQEKGGPMVRALEALTNGVDMIAAVKSAKPFVHKQIISFNQIRQDVYGELSNVELVAGVKWKRFPQLTGILKGHRPGELTIFTGPTGRGKTTLIGELSLDLCSQGVSTLWGSFEIRNVRLAKTLIKQYSGLNLEHHLGQYDYWADRFQQLPLFFMGFHGSTDVSTVIETMAHAVYVHDIRHVIVDNLQFMLDSTNMLDRYSAQNQAIGKLRKFASRENVHVTVVIHPRKEDETNELTTASIFGTAKASQEADNVVILQCPRGHKKYLQVTKNRFDGDLGRVPLYWDKDTCTMSGQFNSIDTPSSEQQSKKLESANSYSHEQTLTADKLESNPFSYFGSGKTVSKPSNQFQSHTLTSTKKTSSPTLSKPLRTFHVSSPSGSPLAAQAIKSQGSVHKTKHSSVAVNPPNKTMSFSKIQFDDTSHLG